MSSFLEGLAQAALGGTAQAANAAAEDWKLRATAAREQAFRKEGWAAEATQRKDMLKEETAARRDLAKEEMAGRKDLSAMELAARKEEGAAERGSRSADRAADREARAADRKMTADLQREMLGAKQAAKSEQVKSVTRMEGDAIEGGKVLTTYESGKQSVYDPKSQEHVWVSSPQEAKAAPPASMEEATQLGLSGASAMMYGQARQKYPNADPKVLLQGLKSDPRTKVYFPD